ncbi:MAG: hypothetical protein ICV55_10515 [Coleofasciculus sp. C3-bin4]|nr:hypothetical protein [Coleofasciculus sp. C3-bin4]
MKLVLELSDRIHLLKHRHISGDRRCRATKDSSPCSLRAETTSFAPSTVFITAFEFSE